MRKGCACFGLGYTGKKYFFLGGGGARELREWHIYKASSIGQCCQSVVMGVSSDGTKPSMNFRFLSVARHKGIHFVVR